jgi:hypothetical protein
MFDQYTYLNNLVTVIPEGKETPALSEIKAVKRISGLRELEEMLEDLRGLQYPLILAEDKGDGFLSFTGRNLDNGYHSFYLVSKAKIENSASRTEIQAQCMVLAKKVFKQMLADSMNFGDPAYGFDTSRIDYRRVGPLVNNFHGYSFSYIVKDENITL